jgi:hypothetical protein
MMRSVFASRLDLIEGQLAAPAPEGFVGSPAWRSFTGAMSEEGRAAFRMLLEHRIEADPPEHEVDATPLAGAVRLAQRYVDHGLAPPVAFSRAAVEMCLAAGLTEG